MLSLRPQLMAVLTLVASSTTLVSTASAHATRLAVLLNLNLHELGLQGTFWVCPH